MQLWHCADIDYKTMTIVCRAMRISDADIGLAGSRHYLNDAPVASDVIDIWAVLGGLRKDWSWFVRFMVLRERDQILPAFKTDIQHYIEMGEDPQQHQFWCGSDDVAKALRPIRRRREGGGRGGHGRGRARRPAAPLMLEPGVDDGEDPEAIDDGASDDSPSDAGASASTSPSEGEATADSHESILSGFSTPLSQIESEVDLSGDELDTLVWTGTTCDTASSIAEEPSALASTADHSSGYAEGWAQRRPCGNASPIAEEPSERSRIRFGWPTYCCKSPATARCLRASPKEKG